MARRKTSQKKAAKRKEANQPHQGWFSRVACEIARLAGKPAVFIAATAAIILWAASGPIFGFSDTWQLVVNTSTTIITFLMVFLIQNTQNRDAIAVQIKLDELIFRLHGADNKIAAVEHMSDEELEQLHLNYQERAEHALSSLNERRAKQKKAA